MARLPTMIEKVNAEHAGAWPAFIRDPKSRLYTHLYDLCASVDAFLYGGGVLSGNANALRMTSVAFPSLQFDLKLTFDVGPNLRNAIDIDAPLHEIITYIDPKDGTEGDGTPLWSLGKIKHILTNIAQVEFVKYYENYIDVIRRNSHNNWRNYKKPWDFARVVRNSISHNKVNINDPNAQTVSWYNLSYGPVDNGRVVIGCDLGLADIWILMEELDGVLGQIVD